MAKRIGNSFSDIMNSAQQLVAGLNDASDDPKQTSYAKQINDLYENLRSLDEQQEKAKADLHTISQELQKSEKDMRTAVAKAISYLESEYGKTNPKLQKYGIARRQTAGSRAGQKKKTPEPAKS